MKAVTYQGVKNIEVKEVESPTIHKPDDIIIRITSTGICGSDLHLIHGMIPNLPQNYINCQYCIAFKMTYKLIL